MKIKPFVYIPPDLPEEGAGIIMQTAKPHILAKASKFRSKEKLALYARISVKVKGYNIILVYNGTASGESNFDSELVLSTLEAMAEYYLEHRINSKKNSFKMYKH